HVDHHDSVHIVWIKRPIDSGAVYYSHRYLDGSAPTELRKKLFNLDFGSLYPSDSVIPYPVVIGEDSDLSVFCAATDNRGWTRIFYRNSFKGIWGDSTVIYEEEDPNLAYDLDVVHSGGEFRVLLVCHDPNEWTGEYSTVNIFGRKVGNQWQFEHLDSIESYPEPYYGGASFAGFNYLVEPLFINNEWNIYYREWTGDDWSAPILVRDTDSTSRHPKGTFDGENIVVVWTDGDDEVFQIKSERIRVAPEVKVLTDLIGRSLYAGEEIEIEWQADDDVGIKRVDSVLVFSGDRKIVIGADLPYDQTEITWSIPFEELDSCYLSVQVSDSAGNIDVDTTGPFAIGIFETCGFEAEDPPVYDNHLISQHGVTNGSAYRVMGQQNGVGPHSGSYMYRISGEDVSSTENSYIWFKLTDADIIVHDSLYLSFWLYVEKSPNDLGHILIDGRLKSGKALRDWTIYGPIIDQTGQRIHPAEHTTPKGGWYQYVFTLNPARDDTIDYLMIGYDDGSNNETGEFLAYIDDIEFTDRFPIKDIWHVEKHPSDTNCIIDFELAGDGAQIIIDNKGKHSPSDTLWSTGWLRKDLLKPIWITNEMMVYFHQFDLAHSLILGLLIKDDENNKNWLYYARNADNHWYKEGWVDLGLSGRNYHQWEGLVRNIRDDYYDEYGKTAIQVLSYRIGHFSKGDWQGDHGGTIDQLRISSGEVEFTGSGFGDDDPLPYEECIEMAQGCRLDTARRYYYPPNGEGWVYRVTGEDTSSTRNSYLWLRLYDQNVSISRFLSFKIRVDQAPTESAHIFIDGRTKSGIHLRDFFSDSIGYVIEQNGDRIHAGIHKVPVGGWVEYIVNLLPTVGDPVDYLVVGYDDGDPAETGRFSFDIDDLKVWDEYPHENEWYCERLGNDQNLILRFTADETVDLYIDPNGDTVEFWVNYPRLGNNVEDLPVSDKTILKWDQYDLDHSLILSLLIYDTTDTYRWLHYARNAANHWPDTGWVAFPDSEPVYNEWEGFIRRVKEDYIEEYGDEPLMITELNLGHFAKSTWQGNHGGKIANLLLTNDAKPPEIELVFPQGGEHLMTSDTILITWEAKDTLPIVGQSVYYSTDQGETWILIAEEAQESLSYYCQWVLPSEPIDDCLIKIEAKDYLGNLGVAISAPFDIEYLASACSTALAGGHRIIGDGEKVALVYDHTEGVYLATTTNSGVVWERRYLGPGHDGNLGVYDGDTIVVWADDNRIYQNGAVIHEGERIGDLSLVIGDSCYLVFTEDAISPNSYNHWLKLMVFAPGGESHLTTIDSSAAERFTAPDLTLCSGEVVITYLKADSVQLYKSGTIQVIGKGRNPRIRAKDEGMILVYEDSGEIYLSKGWIWGDFSEAENISQTPQESKDPVVTGGFKILYLERPEVPDGKWDLILRDYQGGYLQREGLVDLQEEAYYPQAILTDSTIVYTYAVGVRGYGIEIGSKDSKIHRMVSDRDLATGPNNGEKLAYYDQLHLFYNGGGFIYDSTAIIGYGSWWAGAVADSLVFMLVSGRNIYLRVYGEEWSPPRLIYSVSEYEIGPIAFGLRDSITHLIWEETREVVNGTIWRLRYLRFNYHNPADSFLLTVDSVFTEEIPEIPSTPDIALDHSGRPHIVYSQEGRIYYRRWHQLYMGFTRKIDLTDWIIGDPDGHSPVIDIYKYRITTAFVANNDVWTRFNYYTKLAYLDTNWSAPVNLSNSGSITEGPVIGSGSHILWADQVLKHAAYDGWSWEVETAVIDPTCHWPQLMMKDNRMFYLWTEGFGPPYQIRLDSMEVEIPNWLCGVIENDTVFADDQILIGDVIIDSLATVTIEPGVGLYALPFDVEATGKDSLRVELMVYGDLSAVGTETDSIIFTAYGDNPVPGDWYGIRFMEIREGEEGSEKAETRL
ncbi:hypothetical protein DRP53_10000, partial [candidate division WOR-3 bacterium]